MEKYEFILKNNQKLIIRKACEDDAERFLKYFNYIKSNFKLESSFCHFLKFFNSILC